MKHWYLKDLNFWYLISFHARLNKIILIKLEFIYTLEFYSAARCSSLKNYWHDEARRPRFFRCETLHRPTKISLRWIRALKRTRKKLQRKIRDTQRRCNKIACNPSGVVSQRETISILFQQIHPTFVRRNFYNSRNRKPSTK